MAAKGAWLLVVVYAVWLMTVGLAASFYIEDTSAALAAERHGQGQVELAAVLLLGLAGVAWFAFEPRVWSVVVLGTTALVLLRRRATLDLAFVADPAAVPRPCRLRPTARWPGRAAPRVSASPG